MSSMWRVNLIPKTVCSAHLGVTSLLALGWAGLCVISRSKTVVGYWGRPSFLLYGVDGKWY